MHPGVTPREAVRRVFAAWSITIPESFAETFIDDEGYGYWHAYDEHRSVSLTSLALTDEDGPVAGEMIASQLPSPEATPIADGQPVDLLPPGLAGWAVEADAWPPARASRVLTGMLAAEGRVLLATITSDDLDWARRTWLSIRCHRADLPGSHSPPHKQPWRQDGPSRISRRSSPRPSRPSTWP